ncbi:hypothetical protein T07_13813 [Trichinella nelsoni]|uniref:Uncharacterized protein n=1 Tax=Trichinella nelsoni TaxID=6336 RepID=A0A0V0RC09_9BILA|nr:hypothetical protein T07_13813 [Trichinella nelsoni]
MREIMRGKLVIDRRRNKEEDMKAPGTAYLY